MFIVLKIFQIWEIKRRKDRKRKEGKEQKKEKKIGRNTSVRKDSIKAPTQRHILIQRQVIIVLDGSSKTRLLLILVS